MKVDKALKDVKLPKGGYLKYVLFRGSSIKGRSEIFHRNNVMNVKASYEILENVNVFDEAENNGKIGSVRGLLLDIKLSSKKPLFYRVEKGIGQNENKVIVLYNPRSR